MSLRAVDNPYMLTIPRINNHLLVCSCAFYYAAPHLYNALPLSMKSANKSESFKRQLKTYFFLFNKSYNNLNKCASELYRT